MAQKLRPSSGTAGFFQEAPVLVNPYHEDAVLQRIANFYLPSSVRDAISPDLEAFGAAVVSPRIHALLADAERNPPTVTTHTTWGVSQSVLHTSRGWRELQAYGQEQGIVAIAYEAEHGHHSRVYQFLKYHVWTPSSAIVTCPSAMTDGAAKLMLRHLGDRSSSDDERRVFREAYRGLTSRDSKRAWTSGQWMTERTGGSDVRGTETVATLVEGGKGKEGTDASGLPLGPYSISGFKWFSSATDSNMAVLLAKTANGLGVFMAPMRRSIKTATGNAEAQPAMIPDEFNTELNGITIQRLKSKLGTKPVPTAELVLDGTRGWLIGDEMSGVREIATVLNITRVHTGMGSLGFWGRGLAIARAFARVRTVDGGKRLDALPSHLKQMARNTVNYAAMNHLGFFTVMLLGITEQPSTFKGANCKPANELVSDVDEAVALFRLFTAVHKAQCSKMAIYGLQECMESLGGVGYLEDGQETNIARLYRDCSVNAIWEGTTDVMAHDVIRVVKGREGVRTQKALRAWVERITESWHNSPWADAATAVKQELTTLETAWIQLDIEELKFRGRETLEALAWIVALISLVSDARSDGAEIVGEIARRWLATRRPSVPAVQRSWLEESKWDRKIVFGADAEFARL